MTHPSFARLGNFDAIETERAAMDLRRGLPVVIGQGATRPAVLAASAERIGAAGLAIMREHAVEPLFAVLTPERARTLKIRLYTQDAIALPLKADDTTAVLNFLADPAHDLSAPLSGPFQAERSLPDLALAQSVRLCKIAGLLPCAVAGQLAHGDAPAFARENRLSFVSASSVDAYDLAITDDLEAVVSASLPLADAPDALITTFRSASGGPEHYAILIGNPQPDDPVLVRVHSECFTGDLLGSLKCDCGDQLRGAIKAMAQAGKGVLLYLAQEGRGIGLMNKLRAYALQDQGFDTVEANERLGFAIDERAFRPAAQMLKSLALTKIRLLTNNPAKVDALAAHGITVIERVPHQFATNPHNADYLRVKAEKTGHLLDDEEPGP